jgi:hypothetical protein
MVILAHTGESRFEQFPEVPTFKERGVDIVRYHWRGMVLKKGTPEPVIDRTYALVGTGVKSARFQAYLKDSATLDGTMTRAAMAEMLAEQAYGLHRTRPVQFLDQRCRLPIAPHETSARRSRPRPRDKMIPIGAAHGRTPFSKGVFAVRLCSAAQSKQAPP